jgi:enoyl-CoA hydratase/carnithine racemase
MELTPGTVRLPAALDAVSVPALARALEEAWQSGAPVVTLAGHDAHTFCAGVALDAALDAPASMRAFADLLAALHASPVPLLAVVDGAALGGGLGLASACDWVVATDRATFGLPELLWGLAPAIIWPVVTDRMAPHLARQWTISAHARGAAEAQAAGVVDEVTSAEALERRAERARRMLARIDGHALTRFRAWARASRELALPEAVTRGVDVTTALAARPEARRRWRAFSEGAAPWSA